MGAVLGAAACHKGGSTRVGGAVDEVASESAEARSVTRVFVEGEALYLLGTFDSGTAKAVLDVLDRHPEIEVLVFTANGGSTDDRSVLALGREIRRRGLATHVVDGGVLASGGLSLFLSGVRRTYEGRFGVGVHSWEGCNDQGQCVDGRDLPRDDPGHRLHGDYIEEMLGSRDLYWFAIGQAPSSAIYWMTPEDVARFEIAQPVEARAFRSTSGQVPPPEEFLAERWEVCGECEAALAPGPS